MTALVKFVLQLHQEFFETGGCPSRRSNPFATVTALGPASKSSSMSAANAASPSSVS